MLKGDFKMEDVIKISFTEETNGESVADGMKFFENHIKPVVPTGECRILFKMESDTVQTRFIWGVFTAFIDHYFIENGDKCEEMGIGFANESLELVFDLVRTTYIASLKTVVDLEEDEYEEPEQEFYA